MKLSYITTYDPRDISQWSGLGYYIAQSLQRQGVALDFVGPLKKPHELSGKLKSKLYQKLFGKTYLLNRNASHVRQYAEQVQQKLSGSDADVLFSPGTLPSALLKDSRPFVFWTDATFDGMVNFYPKFTRLSAESLRDGHRLEQMALDRCALAIYSSDWAAQSAIDQYGVDPKKVKVVPFGANLTEERSYHSVQAIIDQKDTSVCKLLFLGVDWQRKGGPLALDVTQKLNQLGIPTELWVAGCIPPIQQPFPPYVKSLGFISKGTETGRQQIESLLKQAHFLFLPSEADCTPIVFSEANSLGLPVITTNVGGIPTIIRDDINGKKFSLSTDSQAYVDYIQQVFSDSQRYKTLCQRAFREYQKRLNWNVAAQHVKELIQQIL